MGDRKIEISDTIKKNVSEEQLMDLEDKLEVANGQTTEKLGQTKVKNLLITTILSAVLGLFGGGSFYLGRIRAGILKIVFNVLVPLTLAIVFLGWLVPQYKLYSVQTYNLATELYITANDQQTASQDKKMTVIDMGNADWLEGAIHIIQMKKNHKTAIDRSGIKYSQVVTAYEEIGKADKTEIENLTNAREVKGALDLLDLKTVTVGEDNASISLEMGFAELMSQPSGLTVQDLSKLYDEYSSVIEKADALIAEIEQMDYDDKSINDALKTVSQNASDIKKQIINNEQGKAIDLLQQIDNCKSDVEWFVNFRPAFKNLLSNVKIEAGLDKKHGYSKTLEDIADGLENIQTCKLSELTNTTAYYNDLFTQSLNDSYDYIINSAMATWIPATFLIIDGITILCWWIGEVFNDRKKCRNQNYQKLLRAIEN